MSASTAALPSVVRRPLFGSLRRTQNTVDQGTLSRSTGSLARPASQVQETAPDVLVGAKGKLCYICGAPTLEQGTGLRSCSECGSLVLKSGFSSHAHSVKEESRSGSKKSIVSVLQDLAQAPVDSGLSASMNPMASRSAWRRLSSAGPIGLDQAPGNNAIDPEDREPIMAGIVDTGYKKGDRVKTNMRLAGGKPPGWDPIEDASKDEGTVIGPGREAGHIMVKFDHSGSIVSMKLGQIEPLKAKAAMTNVARSNARKSLPRLTTL